MSASPDDPSPAGPEQGGLPSFIISVGTQVVLKSDKRVPGTDVVKPVGSVAEVLESPVNNSRPYLIRFVDGVTMRVKFAELVIRKREVAEELATPGPDLRRFVILRVAGCWRRKKSRRRRRSCTPTASC